MMPLASRRRIECAVDMNIEIDNDMTGKLLIAMPGINDPRFEYAVVFIVAHSDEGAMGLLINKVSDEINVADVFKQLEIDTTGPAPDLPVHFGGPVEMGRGFVLHSTDYTSDQASMGVTEQFSMTASLGILRDIAKGAGPKRRILCLGYSGWDAGQLEAELGDNGWLICEASTSLVFDTKDPDKWGAALQSIGVSPALLSGDAGHA